MKHATIRFRDATTTALRRGQDFLDRLAERMAGPFPGDDDPPADALALRRAA